MVYIYAPWRHRRIVVLGSCSLNASFSHLSNCSHSCCQCDSLAGHALRAEAICRHDHTAHPWPSRALILDRFVPDGIPIVIYELSFDLQDIWES